MSELTELSPADLASILEDEVECECMLCHLPEGDPHPPIEWRYTVTFPGPYPEAGTETMLLCNPCLQDWIENQGTLMGHTDRVHPV